jgi:hypothetical protein
MLGPGVKVTVGRGVPEVGCIGSGVGNRVAVSVGVTPAEMVALMDSAVR